MTVALSVEEADRHYLKVANTSEIILKRAAKKNATNRKAAKKRIANGTSTRVERAKKTRDAKKRGVNTKGKDYDHAVGRFVSAKTNRGRAGEGGRRKGMKKPRK